MGNDYCFQWGKSIIFQRGIGAFKDNSYVFRLLQELLGSPPIGLNELSAYISIRAKTYLETFLRSDNNAVRA